MSKLYYWKREAEEKIAKKHNYNYWSDIVNLPSYNSIRIKCEEELLDMLSNPTDMTDRPIKLGDICAKAKTYYGGSAQIKFGTVTKICPEKGIQLVFKGNSHKTSYSPKDLFIVSQPLTEEELKKVVNE